MSESTYPIITRAEAKRLRLEAQERGDKYYFTGVPCKRGHVVERFVKTKQCTECNREDCRTRRLDDPKWRDAEKRSYKKHSDKRNQQAREWYLNNKDKMDDYYSEWRENHREEAIERTKEWQRNNPNAVTTQNKKYREQNKDKIRHWANKRRAQKLNATPVWITDEELSQIEALYAECVRLEQETGIKHHVDHIVPLQGEHVSGLHILSNLQVLTAHENGSKNNKYDI